MSEQNSTNNTCTVTTSIQIHVNGLKECITICKYTSTQIMLVISKKITAHLLYLGDSMWDQQGIAHSGSIWATHYLYMNYIKT